MSATYPFKIAAAKSATDPARQFAIVVELSEMDEYSQLFENHGYGGTGASWCEHIETIIEEFEPDLLEHLEFDETDDNFLAYADSLAAVRQFMACVLPYFADLGKLKKYLDQTDPGDFFA